MTFDPPAGLLVEAVPPEALSALTKYGGREGFLGREYFRLYRVSELIALNRAYGVPDFAPEVFIFGSDGAGEAYAFVIGSPCVVRIPFIPLSIEHAEIIASDFRDFIGKLASSGQAMAFNPAAVGMIIHAKHPIILGGSPTDPENRILVPQAKHAELAVYWNKVCKRAAG